MSEYFDMAAQMARNLADGVTQKLWWDCKHCGQNERPYCHKCMREDGKGVTDELVDFDYDDKRPYGD